MSLVIALVMLADGGAEPVVGSGGLSKDVIQKVINRHQTEVKFCYERELVENPKLKGKVTVTFTVAPDGKVASAEVASSDLTKTIDACITGRIKTWAFPPPQGGGVVTITFPWIFVPKD